MLKSWIGGIRTPGASRAWLAVFVMLVLVSLLLGAAGFVLGGLAARSPAETIATLIAALFIGAGLAALFARLASLAGQHARDLDAQAIAEALERGEEPGPFTLYLRPFASTDVFDATRLRVTSVNVRPGGGGGFIAPPERFELERQFMLAAKAIGPMVALGAPLEHIGAGRILVPDDGWKPAIERLMAAARLIILLPSSREGTLWEVEQLLDDELIARTVVVDPPNGSVKGRAFDHASEWQDVRDAFARRGYTLPDDDRRGLVTFFGRSKEPTLTERLDIANAGKLRRFFREVVKAV